MINFIIIYNAVNLFCIKISGVNGKPVYRISFRFGRNYEIRKEYLSTGYWKRHYIRLSTG